MNLTTKLAVFAMLTAASVSAFAQTFSFENPQPNSYQSGLSVFSGWSCSTDVQISVDGTRYRAAAGTPRTNFPTNLCNGNSNVNFALLKNFNNFGGGAHSAQLVIDGQPVGTPVQFNVTVPIPSQPFATGLSGMYTLTNFPTAGQNTTVVWQESQQNFAISGVNTGVTPPAGSGACGTSNFTKAKYDAIVLGMTLAQVTSAIGCSNDPSRTIRQTTDLVYAWTYTSLNPITMYAIYVVFDISGSMVIDMYAGTGAPPYFKWSTGF